MEFDAESLHSLLEIAKNVSLAPLIRVSAVEQLLETFPFRNHALNFADLAEILSFFCAQTAFFLQEIAVLSGALLVFFEKSLCFLNNALLFCSQAHIINLDFLENAQFLEKLCENLRLINSLEIRFQVSKLLFLWAFDHRKLISQGFRCENAQFLWTFSRFSKDFFQLVPEQALFEHKHEEIAEFWTVFREKPRKSSDSLEENQRFHEKYREKRVVSQDFAAFLAERLEVQRFFAEFRGEAAETANIEAIFKRINADFSQFRGKTAIRAFDLLEIMLKTAKNPAISRVIEEVWKHFSGKITAILLEVLFL